MRVVPATWIHVCWTCCRLSRMVCNSAVLWLCRCYSCCTRRCSGFVAAAVKVRSDGARSARVPVVCRLPLRWHQPPCTYLWVTHISICAHTRAHTKTLSVATASGFKGRIFVVAVHVVPPFIFYDKSKTGNEQFSGITVDLLDELGNVLCCCVVVSIPCTRFEPAVW